MAFKSFNGVSDAARAVQDYLMDHGSDVPEELRTKLRDLVGPTTSPVDTVVRSAELIYARTDDEDIPSELKELGAGLALVAQQYNFHGMAEDDRGTNIALAFMRDADVPAPTGVTYPDKEHDPHVKDEFKKAEVVEEAPQAARPATEPTSRVENITDPAKASFPDDNPTPKRRRRAAS